MHQQVRVSPRTSPADLERVLRFLADEPLEGDEVLDPDQPVGVNLVAAGGSRVELGGRFAFAVDHRHKAACERALARGDYGDDKVRWFTDGDGHLTLGWLDNRPGQLAVLVAQVRETNGDEKRIKDILVGVERDDQNRVPVQIFSVAVDGDDDDDGDDD